jgi:sulfide dehydrogenase cytochrome subunit
MKRTIFSALAVAGALFAGGHAAAGPIDPAVYGNTCAGCHGTFGASEGQAPVIAGLAKPYLSQTMMNYKNGARHSTIMGRIAKGYTPQEIDAMAHFYASQPWQNGKEEVDGSLVDKGRQLHMTRGCMGCHGPNGISPSPTTPRLAGQYSKYLVIQMKDYQDASKAIPPTAMPMRMMLGGLGDADLRALAAFYASQR